MRTSSAHEETLQEGDWNEKFTTHDFRHETNEVYVIMTNNELAVFQTTIKASGKVESPSS